MSIAIILGTRPEIINTTFLLKIQFRIKSYYYL